MQGPIAPDWTATFMTNAVLAGRKAGWTTDAPMRIMLLLPALVLLWLGCAHVIEGVRAWPLTQYVHAAWWQKGATPNRQAVLGLQPGRPDGRAWSAYGQALQDAAHLARKPALRDRYLQSADAATRKALSLSPAQAATWARFSLIALNRGERRAAVDGLEPSFALAPNGVNLAWPRAKLGLYLWDELDAGTQAAVARDLHRLQRQPPTPALPYPAAALHRYARAIGRSGLVVTIIGQDTSGAH